MQAPSGSSPTPRRRFPLHRNVPGAIALLALGLWPASALAALANDDFAEAELISESKGSASGSNVDATKETGEPDHAGNAGGHSVWYSWTAPADGNVSFTTARSAFDTLLAVYTGSAVDSLTPIAANDDDPGDVFGGRSTVSFAVSNGSTYMVAVDGFSGKSGFVNLAWRPAPANDNFAEAEVLSSTASGTATGDAKGATLEPGEPSFVLGGGTIWYSWTAPADGDYKFDTVGSDFDTVIGLYEGSTLDALEEIGVNDDDPDRGCCSSWVPIDDALGGTIYSIAVSSFGGGRAGELVLNWSPVILGTPAADTLLGTAGDDEIRGLAGADVIRSRGGNDTVFGGRGNDIERGGPGNDFVADRSGADRLFGNDGDDSLDARDFRPNDLLSGGGGVDSCRGDRRDARRGCP